MPEPPRAPFAVRAERPADHRAVYDVVCAAFGRPAEARLVDALRMGSAFIPGLSLVAEAQAAIVGHVLFTRLAIVDETGSERAGLALAPLAVLPEWQSRGVGSALVRQGLEQARAFGQRVVLVLGHPTYYARFGFEPAIPLGIRAPFEPSSPEALRVLGLVPGALADWRGLARYPPEFGAF